MSAPAPSAWLRLDKRMLLVHPVTEVVKFVPVLIGMLILGTSSGNHGWSLIPLLLIVGFALTRWFTTTYRIGPTHVELRTGLVQRRTLSVPRSRIRSVDIESDLLHRGLGLAVVVLGTGQQADTGEKFRLDSLDQRSVPALRATLLDHLNAPDPGEAPEPGAAEDHPRGREIGHWQPAWVRYAPLSLTGFAVIAPIVGVGFQYGLGEIVFSSDAAHTIEEGTAALIAAAVLGLLAAVVALVSLAACTRYLTTYHRLRVLDDDRTLHIRHGLFTTRQITLDLARFRGATVNEPLLLRWAGGAELEAIMVGENARQKLLPQAPRAAVERTLTELLAPRGGTVESGTRGDTGHVGTDGTPATEGAGTLGIVSSTGHPGAGSPGRVRPAANPATGDEHKGGRTSESSTTGSVSAQGTAPLLAHGPVARRRRYTRALTLPGIAAAFLLVLNLIDVSFSPWWWTLPAVTAALAAALAEDRYRGLGHAVIPATAHSPAWLITRSGSLDRDRDCLQGPGIIGWTVSRSYWQRRSGVATLVAATAAGKKRYLVIDLPLADAYRVIDAVTPGLLGVGGNSPSRVTPAKS
ncbi:PH domain-containing protein [Nocardia takedensis]|uniref:PH domain-containing protein n=1 Tax=Nocardia takedensis TaxID=259390 RepID=UPI000304D2CD